MILPNESAVRDLITDLRLSDEETGGYPVLPIAGEKTAREYLEVLLVLPFELARHLDKLDQLYQGNFRAPLTRRLREGFDIPLPPGATANFRHATVLPEPLALEVMERGVQVLQSDVLARTLLNPLALWDLADLICTLLPDYWMDRMDEVGAQWAKENDIDLYEDFEEVVGAPLPKEKTNRKLEAALAGRKTGDATTFTEVVANQWLIDVPADVRDRIATMAFHQPNKHFDVYLYRVGGNKAQLAIAPAPTHGDVRMPVTMRTGEAIEFVVEVPSDERNEMRSGLSQPLPAEAFAITGREWVSEGEWLRLVFR
jgi:hypothetical protein